MSSIWGNFDGSDTIIIVRNNKYAYEGRVADMPEELKHERYDWYGLNGIEEADYIMLDFS